MRGTILARGQRKTWELIDTKYDTKRAKLGFTKFWSNYGSQNSGIRMKLYKLRVGKGGTSRRLSTVSFLMVRP